MPAIATAPRQPTVAQLVELTPRSRDRTVDLLRAGAIAVVVLWHWCLSVTHRDGAGRFTMPNPLDRIPGAWALTWVLQVMPLFFVVGGFADLAAWTSARRRGDGAADFWRSRARRLLVPPAAMAGAWAAVEVVRLLVAPGSRSVVDWGLITFVPLWFLAAYAVVTAAVPATAWLHRRFGWRAAAVLVTLPLVVDRLRLDGRGWLAVPGSLLVFVACHQLGYLWRDGTIRRPWALVAGSLLTLVVLTTVGGYSRSMVATSGGRSNMFPTTAAISVLAVLQLGLAVGLRPSLVRLCARRRVWAGVVAANGIAMTVFAWHMTAWVLAGLAWERLVGPLGAQPTAHWWLARPLWALLPAIALAPLVAIFRRLET